VESAPPEKSAGDVRAPKAPDSGLRYQPKPLELADRRLLLQEITRLETLVKGTRKKSRDRAALVLRLAEAYAELARVSQRELTIREMILDEAERERAAAEREQASKPPAKRPAPSGPPRRTAF